VVRLFTTGRPFVKILLVYPNAKKEIIGWGDKGAIAEPIALEYIGAIGRDCGHEVKLLDLRLHNDDLDTTVEQFQPDMVGVTGYSMHVLRCLEICRIVKRIRPECLTVAGGHHATLEAVDFFEPEIDLVVIGEGTGPFRSILGCLEQGKRVEGIPAVWSRIDGEFVLGGAQAEFDINLIPQPDRTLVPDDRADYFIDWMKPIALLRTTVGCPYRCSFCALWRIMDGQYYKREVDLVVEELKQVEEKNVFIVDDEPFVNSKRMMLLAQEIEKAGIEKNFFSYCRIDSLLKDMDLMRYWAGIGLKRLLIGVETIFDYELADYNKRQERTQIVEGLQAAKSAGISLFCNFIIHPRYTHKEFEEVIRFIRENEVDYPSFTIWTPIPGTNNNYEDVIQRQANGRPNWDYFDLQHPVTETTLPKEEFMEQFENLYQVFASNYLQAESPMTVTAMNEKHVAMGDPSVRLAMKVLGMIATDKHG
jgi:radical SAM superfamily enzyme YgiQ (UPF0313 family)